MTQDVFTLARRMIEDGDFDGLVNDPMIQFGDPMQNTFYLGASFLPEELKLQNMYKEEQLQFNTLIADDSTPYSPQQLKKAARAITMRVELGSIDAGRSIEAQMLDRLNEYVSRCTDESVARAAILNMIRQMSINAIADKKELSRWQAISNGEGDYINKNVTKKNNKYNPPADLRPDYGVGAAGLGIKDDATDPIENAVQRGIDILRDTYGYETMMIVSRSKVKRDIAKNGSAKDYMSQLTVTSSLNLARTLTTNQNSSFIDEILGANDMPMWVTYDGYYRDETGQKFFLKDDELYFLARTPRDNPFLTDDPSRLFEFNRIGYYGIGKCQNQTTPGDILKIQVHDDGKPDYLLGLVDSRSSPVITSPEAICVIKNLYNN